MKSKSESPKNEFKHLNSEKIRLKDKLRKCRTSRYDCVVVERPGIAENVYDVKHKVGRGGDIR